MSKTHAAYVLSSFINDVKSSKLPQVSWIVAPAGYCEHPSYTPDYGAHYVNTVLQTLFSNPALWRNTALFITYDEHDGFFDHQLPPFPEATVTDEYIGALPIGPGTRVPMMICSPWTRGGYVDSNVYDHITYTVTRNDYQGSTKTVTVRAGGSKSVSWPTDHYGYYDVVITANTADNFRRRYAGRID